MSSMVGRSQPKETAKQKKAALADAPLYPRLGSGYAIKDPVTERTIGEILRKKKGTGWRMTFHSERYEASCLGPLMTISGCLWRADRNRPEPLPTPTLPQSLRGWATACRRLATSLNL